MTPPGAACKLQAVRHQAQQDCTRYLQVLVHQQATACRLLVGGQLLAYVQASKQKCETSDGVRTCTGTTEDENAIPWRAVAVGTWLFGG